MENGISDHADRESLGCKQAKTLTRKSSANRLPCDILCSQSSQAEECHTTKRNQRKSISGQEVKEKHSHKKSRKRTRSSSSSSSSDSDKGDSRFQTVLDEQRAEKRRLRKLEKEKLKAKETPEEKRARRLAKKLKKEEKRKKENKSYLPPQIAYTNLNNPFNDVNLTETFVWGKKLEREGKAGLSRKEIEKEWN
ncbi:hypothetical protein OSTOST_18224 [Ostertagia ostertagi]